MLRLILFISIVAFASVAVSWISAHEGRMVISWLGYRIETSVLVLIVAAIAVIVSCVLSIQLVLYVVNTPKRWKHKRKDKAFSVLTKGFSALITQDASTADKSAQKALKLLHNDVDGKPLATLLAAYAASLKGDTKRASIHYNSLTEHKTTQLAGIKGLLAANVDHTDTSNALALARDALRLQPNNAQNILTLLELFKREQLWADIQLLLHQYSTRKWNKIIGNLGNYAHEKSLALYMRAQEQQQKMNYLQAAELTNEAHTTTPSFIPAALLACELADGSTRTIRAICKRSWKAQPYAKITQIYMDSLPNSKPKSALSHALKLTSLNPNHPESHLLLGQCYLKTNDLDKARNFTKLALGAQETAAAYSLMAEIESASHNSEDVINEWKMKSQLAPDSEQWSCQKCGYISGETWQVTCSHCNSVGTIGWKNETSFVKTKPLEIGAITPS